MHDEINHTSSDHDQMGAEQSAEYSDCEQLVNCQQELAVWKDKFVHLAADFENYKRRQEKERAHWQLMTHQRLFVPLLAIVDDFDRALQQEQQVLQGGKELDAWLLGFTMIGKELHKFLEQFGVRPIAHTTIFDPSFHEAVAEVASEKHAAGEIVDVLQKGYMLNDTVLRPAKVTVAR